MGPDMNSRRAMHNACILGDLLYVFGGTKNAAKDLQTAGLERIRLQSPASFVGAWEFMAVTPRSGIPTRVNYLLAAQSSSEMLFLGGMNTEEMLGDGFTLDVNTKKVRQVRQRDVELDFPGNAWFQPRSGEVVALAISDAQLRIVKFGSGQDRTQFIADFGSAEE